MARHDTRVERPDGAAIVALLGEHDTFTAERLQRTLDALLDEPTSIVIDLGEATFIDSTTVSTLLNARRRAAEQGVEVTLAVPPFAGTWVRRLFETTHLDAVFSIHASRDAALEALQRPAD